MPCLSRVFGDIVFGTQIVIVLCSLNKAYQGLKWLQHLPGDKLKLIPKTGMCPSITPKLLAKALHPTARRCQARLFTRHAAPIRAKSPNLKSGLM